MDVRGVLRWQLPLFFHFEQERFALSKDESQTASVALDRCQGASHRFGGNLRGPIARGAAVAGCLHKDLTRLSDSLRGDLAASQAAPRFGIGKPIYGAAQYPAAIH